MILATRIALVFLILSSASCADGMPSDPTGWLAAKTAPAPNGEVPVSSTVADADPDLAAALQIRSDGSGSYPNSPSLTSVVQDIGAWVLDSRTPKNGSRRLYLAFSEPVAGSGPNGGPPIGVPSGLYQVRAMAKCNLYGTSLLTLGPGATVVCPLHIGFDYGSTTYAVQMNPYPSAGDPDGAPETNYVNVRCIRPLTGTGRCTQWRITPSATPGGRAGPPYANVARLIKYVTSKGQTTPQNQGDFHFAFSILITNP